MVESLVVTSKVKDAVKAGGMNCGGEFPDALSSAVDELIKKAVKRAEANGRKTVRPEDI